MKKTSMPEVDSSNPDEMLPEYRFDYTRAKPNRFASSTRKRRVAVVLDEDVAEVFSTTDSVNKALRAFIEAMPDAAARRDT
jgi:uncharacterized protein (DUF4415 family)